MAAPDIGFLSGIDVVRDYRRRSNDNRAKPFPAPIRQAQESAQYAHIDGVYIAEESTVDSYLRSTERVRLHS